MQAHAALDNGDYDFIKKYIGDKKEKMEEEEVGDLPPLSRLDESAIYAALGPLIDKFHEGNLDFRNRFACVAFRSKDKFGDAGAATSASSGGG